MAGFQNLAGSARVVSLDRHGAMNEGGRNMPQLSGKLSKGIFGAVAVSLTFGAVQFASGRDLASVSQDAVSQSPWHPPTAAVNRAAKTDRAAGVSASAAQTQTISLRLDGLPDTSVLVRMPVAQAARNASALRRQDPGERDGGLRAGGQRPDRSRQAASAGPLRDLNEPFRAFSDRKLAAESVTIDSKSGQRTERHPPLWIVSASASQ